MLILRLNTPTVPDLSGADDSGISDSDNLTKAATMNLTTTGFTVGDFGPTKLMLP